MLRVPLVDIGSQVLARSLDIGGSRDKSNALPVVNNVPHVDQSEGVWRLETTPEDPTPAILGLWTPVTTSNQIGRLVVYGDADCLTSTHLTESESCTFASRFIFNFFVNQTTVFSESTSTSGR